MVTADDNRRRQLAAAHHVVETHPRQVALAGAEPADARWKTLELHALLREPEPAVQTVVVWKQLEHCGVSARDVLRVPTQGNPTKGASAFAELITDICGNESRVGERVRIARDSCLVAQRVTVIEHLGAAPLI